jgi:hypothetical protein
MGRAPNLRNPVTVSGDERDGGALEALGYAGEFIEELGLDHEPEVLLHATLAVKPQLLGELLLEVLLLVQHELGVRHHEVVRLRLLRLTPNANTIKSERTESINHALFAFSCLPVREARPTLAGRHQRRRRGGRSRGASASRRQRREA